jgi:hypothetical protein
MSAEATDNEEMFLVEGRLTELQTAQTTVNLLKQIEKHAQAKNLAGGVAAAASGMYGMVANAAALTLYEGEDLHNFAAIVGNEVVCGTFRDADRLKDGDNIKAVVSRRGDVLYAHCVLRKKDQQLLLPLMTFAGKKALFRHCMSVAFWGSTFVSVLMASFFLYFWYADNTDRDLGLLAKFMGISLLCPPLMGYPFELWSYRTVKGYGYYASAIFEKLGVPHFNDQTIGTSFELALTKHKARFQIAA